MIVYNVPIIWLTPALFKPDAKGVPLAPDVFNLD